MIGPLLLLAGLTISNESSAGPKRVEFDGDLGCDSLSIQQERMRLVNVMAAAAKMRVEGKLTPEMSRADTEAGKHMAYLSRVFCRRLTGPFDVRDRVESFTEVGFGKATLWVLMP